MSSDLKWDTEIIQEIESNSTRKQIFFESNRVLCASTNSIKEIGMHSWSEGKTIYHLGVNSAARDP
jgi:hypothetical protein